MLLHNKPWPGLAARCLVVVLVGLLMGGCFNLFKKEEPPRPVVSIPMQNPADYGTVANVATAVSKNLEIRPGDLAITVDLDNDQVLLVIQPEDDLYRVGDRVRILRDAKGTAYVQLVQTNNGQ